MRIGHARTVDPAEAPYGNQDALVMAAKGGDRDAFGRLYERFGPMVHGVLLALAPPPAGVTRDLALAKDRAALEAWWNTFGLGNAELFGRWRARPAL